ncbi:MAG: hypothetical protein JW822_14495 [Spirochaetales bacterium]|nr:hypothetical protein [Spirochaetales bacterium]
MSFNKQNLKSRLLVSTAIIIIIFLLILLFLRICSPLVNSTGEPNGKLAVNVHEYGGYYYNNSEYITF